MHIRYFTFIAFFLPVLAMQQSTEKNVSDFANVYNDDESYKQFLVIKAIQNVAFSRSNAFQRLHNDRYVKQVAGSFVPTIYSKTDKGIIIKTNGNCFYSIVTPWGEILFPQFYSGERPNNACAYLRGNTIFDAHYQWVSSAEAAAPIFHQSLEQAGEVVLPKPQLTQHFLYSAQTLIASWEKMEDRFQEELLRTSRAKY